MVSVITFSSGTELLPVNGGSISCVSYLYISSYVYLYQPAQMGFSWALKKEVEVVSTTFQFSHNRPVKPLKQNEIKS